MTKIVKGLGRKGFTIVVLFLSILIGFVISSKFYPGAGLAASVLLFGSFMIQGWQKIKSDPPHNGIVTVLGERTDDVLPEGYHFFPIFPHVFGFIEIKVVDIPVDIPPLNVRTPDDAEIEVDSGLTISPDPSNMIAFQNAGGASGVTTILVEAASEAIREFARDETREPKTWQAATKMAEAFLNEVLENLTDLDPSSDDFKKARKALRGGRGRVKIEELGIILKRVNIKKIHPTGRLAQAAEKEAIEQAERRAETTELQHLRDRLRELMAAPPDGPGYSKEQALEIIQTERGKVTKNIQEHKLSISADTGGILGEILPEVAKVFKK